MKNEYYLASRVPKRGGLVFVRCSRDLSEDAKEEIRENCLEIFVPEKDQNAVLVYPLADGNMNVALAAKVNGGVWENRVHEDIHGMIMSVGEFSGKVAGQLGEEGFDTCFYRGKIEEAEKLPETEFFYKGKDLKSERLDEFWESLQKQEKICFFYAVWHVIRHKKKIYLDVPAEQRRVIQAACYDILPYGLRNRLCTISGGECIQTAADLYFGPPLKYREETEYEKMDLRTFLQEGEKNLKRSCTEFNRSLCRDPESRRKLYQAMQNLIESCPVRAEKEDDLNTPEFYDLIFHIYKKTAGEKIKAVKNKEIRDWLFGKFPYLKEGIKTEKTGHLRSMEEEQADACRNYIKGKKRSDHIIKEIREYYFERSDPEHWKSFQEQLRVMLDEISLNRAQRTEYVSILFLAYENYRDVCGKQEYPVAAAPYDLEAMLKFLRHRIKKPGLYRKYLEEIIFQYSEIFLYYTEEKNIISICKNIGKLFSR